MQNTPEPKQDSIDYDAYKLEKKIYIAVSNNSKSTLVWYNKDQTTGKFMPQKVPKAISLLHIETRFVATEKATVEKAAVEEATNAIAELKTQLEEEARLKAAEEKEKARQKEEARQKAAEEARQKEEARLKAAEEKEKARQKEEARQKAAEEETRTKVGRSMGPGSNTRVPGRAL